MKTKIEVTVKGFKNAVVSEDAENYYINLNYGWGEGVYPKQQFTIEEAITDQVNIQFE